MKGEVKQMIEEANRIAGHASYSPNSVDMKAALKRIHDVLCDALAEDQKTGTPLTVPHEVASALRQNSRPIFSERGKPHAESKILKVATAYAWWEVGDEHDRPPRGVVVFTADGDDEKEPIWYYFPNAITAMKWCLEYLA